jgi:two-component system response regulator PilR (NtrC family)
MPTQVTPSHRLLVVDDEPDLRTLYELTLLREGYDVESAGSVEEAWALLQQRGPGGYHLVITDMRLPDGTGLDLLRRIDDAGRREKAIVITAYGSPENAVEALKAGAYDYLTKPVDLRQFRAVVASALGRAPAGAPTAGAHGNAAADSTIHAGTAGTAGLRPAARAAAPTSAAATHRGRLFGHAAGALAGAEGGAQHGAGAGARRIGHRQGTGGTRHSRGVRRAAAGPFVAVNCGAIPEQLLEAEFFGYRKGAFTGANEDREGFFQAAQGGTCSWTRSATCRCPCRASCCA